MLDEAIYNNLLMAAGVLIHPLIIAYFVFFDNVPALYEKSMKKKRERQLTPYKRNLSAVHGTKTTALVPQPIFKFYTCR